MNIIIIQYIIYNYKSHTYSKYTIMLSPKNKVAQNKCYMVLQIEHSMARSAVRRGNSNIGF